MLRIIPYCSKHRRTICYLLDDKSEVGTCPGMLRVNIAVRYEYLDVVTYDVATYDMAVSRTLGETHVSL